MIGRLDAKDVPLMPLTRREVPEMRYLPIILSAAVLFSVPLRSGAADAPGLGIVPLRVGSTLNDSNAEAYYARENGFFKQVGLNVEMTPFNNGAAAAAALASGSIDITVSPPMQIAQGVTRGLPFTVVAAGAMNTIGAPAAWVCVAKNSPIRTAKDLEGKTIALNGLRSSSQNVLDAWLSKSGGDLTKIRILELPSSEMPGALERGTVDAAMLLEPAFSVATKQGTVRVLAIPTEGPHDAYLQTAWFTTKAFAAQYPATIKKFADAIYLAARWANAHQTDSGTILARLSKLDPAVIGGLNRVRYAESLSAADMAPELDNGYKFGLLPRAVTPEELLAH